MAEPSKISPVLDKRIMHQTSQAGGDCAEEERCAVLFEAPSFERLGEELSGWLSERTDYEPVSFSHAVETRWQRSSAFANSQPVPSYTGMLLVRHQ